MESNNWKNTLSKQKLTCHIMSSVMKKYDTVFTSTNVRKWFTDV